MIAHVRARMPFACFLGVYVILRCMTGPVPCMAADTVARFMAPSVARLAAWAQQGVIMRKGPLPPAYTELLEHGQAVVGEA